MDAKSKLCCLAMLTGAAACAGSSQPDTARIAPAAISIRLEQDRCVVEPQRTVIDYGRERGAPLSVSWNVRKSPFENALIVPDSQEAMPNLFDVLPTIGRFESSDDSGQPIREPIWEGSEYVYRYQVEIEGEKCAGEICIRREGQGCNPPS
jgi:hypothetical protein